MIRQFSKNTCEVCGAPARAVKVARTPAAKKEKMLTGMVWDCPNGHISRTRIHVLEEVKVG